MMRSTVLGTDCGSGVGGQSAPDGFMSDHHLHHSTAAPREVGVAQPEAKFSAPLTCTGSTAVAGSTSLMPAALSLLPNYPLYLPPSMPGTNLNADLQYRH